MRATVAPGDDRAMSDDDDAADLAYIRGRMRELGRPVDRWTDEELRAALPSTPKAIAGAFAWGEKSRREPSRE